MANSEKRPPAAGKGRPKGARNKVTAPVKELAARYTEEALRTLADIMLDAGDEAREGAPPAARVAAAKELLDRAHGKAPQAHTAEVSGTIGLIPTIVVKADDDPDAGAG